MQLGLAFRTPNYWMTQITTIPQVVIFLSVVDAFGRPDLVANALLAPILITMWATSLWTGGSVMRDDRWAGRLEIHVAAPRYYGLVVVARVAAVILLSLLAIPITLATAAATYGVEVRVAHPWVLVLALLVTAGAIVGTGIIFSAMTLISRAAITFQSAASYPFLLLGGVFVPLELLPGWVQPVGRLVFLSWSSDLIRDAASLPVVDGAGWRLVVIAGLGAGGFLLGQWLVRVIIDRVRVTGELSSI
jgi:ABC-2 type transport system permease protein